MPDGYCARDIKSCGFRRQKLKYLLWRGEEKEKKKERDIHKSQGSTTGLSVKKAYPFFSLCVDERTLKSNIHFSRYLLRALYTQHKEGSSPRLSHDSH